MMEVLDSLLRNAAMFRWALFLGLLWLLYRYMERPKEENPLEWWHFFASKGSDGSYYADINKLGQTTGIVVGSFAIVQLSSGAKEDFLGFAAVLTAYFAFVGGVAGYSAFLRSKSGQTQTTTVVEPAADPTKIKTTETTTKPAEPEPDTGEKSKGVKP